MNGHALANDGSKKTYTVTVNDKVWETRDKLRNAIALWKTLAYNHLFKQCSVKLYDENGNLIREKKPCTLTTTESNSGSVTES